MTEHPTNPLRLAMWSGPRNISTALMRAFGNRPDTAVVDEPLYAHYLAATGREHPGRAETLAAGPVELADAVAGLLGPVPEGRRVFYQKHMTHHLLPGIDRSWMRGLTHCFLIRKPREVIASLVKHVPDLTPADTGFPQQAEIFQRVCDWAGKPPPVIDAADVLKNPRSVLSRLCAAVGLEFDERMLHWEPGFRPTDGAWARYWYKEVIHTTGFQPFREKPVELPDWLAAIADECEAHYARLSPHRLTASTINA